MPMELLGCGQQQLTPIRRRRRSGSMKDEVSLRPRLAVTVIRSLPGPAPLS